MIDGFPRGVFVIVVIFAPSICHGVAWHFTICAAARRRGQLLLDVDAGDALAQWL